MVVCGLGVLLSLARDFTDNFSLVYTFRAALMRPDHFFHSLSWTLSMKIVSLVQFKHAKPGLKPPELFGRLN